MKKIYLSNENEHCESNGSITGLMIEDISEFDTLCLEVDKVTLLPKDYLNQFLMFIEETQESCAILSALHVRKECRGQGIGNQLLNDFNRLSKDAQFKFVAARKRMPQNAGFNLEEFYKKHGFETIFETEEEWLMVNTEKVKDVKSFFFMD